MRTATVRFRAGLNPTGTDTRNGEFLRECLGMRPVSGGLEPHPAITGEVLTALTGRVDSWTASRLFRLEESRVVAYAKTAGEVTSGAIAVHNGSAWAPVTVYDWASVLAGGTLSEAATLAPQNWHGFNYRRVAFLFDGMRGVYINNPDEDWAWAYAKDVCRTGCHHQGRILFANFAPTTFGEYSWIGTFLPDLGGFDTNTVWWSSAGADDALMHFLPLGSEGVEPFAPDAAYVERLADLHASGQMGIARVPYRGQTHGVHRLIPIGDHVAVFGRHGMSLLTLQEEPADGYGLTVAAPGWPQGLSLMNRLAVDGDDASGLVALAQDGTVYRIGADGVAVALGYRHLFAGATYAAVERDPLNGGHYIGHPGAAYYLDRYGLSKAPCMPSGLEIVSGGLVSVLSETPASTVRVATDTMLPPDRMGVLSAVRLLGAVTSESRLSVKWLQGNIMRETTPVAPDARGIANVNVPVHAHQVVVSGTPSGVTLDGVELFYADHRNAAVGLWSD